MTNYFEILRTDMWGLSCVVGSCSRETTPCATLACRSLFLFYPLTLSTETNCFLYPSVYVNIDVRTLYIKPHPLPSRTVILCARPLTAVAIHHRHVSSRYASATHPYGFTPASPSSTMIFLTLTP